MSDDFIKLLLRLAFGFGLFFILRGFYRKIVFRTIYQKFCTFSTDDKKRYLAFELYQSFLKTAEKLKSRNLNSFDMDYEVDRNQNLSKQIDKVFKMTNSELNADFCDDSKNYISDYGIHYLKRHFHDISYRLNEVPLVSDNKKD